MISALTALTLILAASACLLAATITDVRDRRIPNRLVLVITMAGLALRGLEQPASLWISLAVWLVTLCLLGLLASRMLVGWGDVKLIAAVTLLFPPGAALPLGLAIAIAGGVLACATLAARYGLRTQTAVTGSRTGLAGLIDREAARIRAHEPMPYAVAVLGGVAWQTITEALRCGYATSCWF